MQVTEQIAAIIGKKLEGQATADELEQLRHWLASPENARAYEQLARIWEESPRALVSPAFDTHTAWQKLDAAITARTGTRGRLRRMPFQARRMAAAAAVIVVLGAAWWLLRAPGRRWEHTEALAANQSLRLPDGSLVELRKGSSLEYPARFSPEERTVRLRGEAFFQVRHNGQQPFLLSTPHARVEVLGTSFLVRSEELLDEIVVATGKVKVSGTAGRGDNLVLTAGRKAVLDQEHISEEAVTGNNYLAWQTGALDFKGTPLVKALEDISHYYNIPLALDGALEKTTATITLRFENEPFDSMLEELKEVTGLQAKKEKGKILLYQK